MFTYPSDLFQQLEFDKVLQMLSNLCIGDRAMKEALSLKLHQHTNYIIPLLEETFEFKISIEENESIQIVRYDSIEEDLEYISVENYVLSIEAVIRIYKLLLNGQSIFNYFSLEKQEKYPTIYQNNSEIPNNKKLILFINGIVDEQGNIRSTASEELQRIDRMISSKERELDSTFRKVSRAYKVKGFLVETVETMRNGRRVLSVKAEFKRKIPGLTHDESATGKTTYIEPEITIAINNTIVGLHMERKKEVYKILKSLSTALSPHKEMLSLVESKVVYLDLVRAKALLAVEMNANKIRIRARPYINYKEAFNPLLLVKNMLLKKETIPFSLRLNEDNRILLLSGPNAGGKSVTMKTVGLLQLMTQSGLLISASEDTELGIFKKFFSDIGDLQSMDDDLSTYSAKLKSMKEIVEKADKQSLVLMDEFGSGTDPRQGGAIAEAILEEINTKKVHGVITTHYSNIKYFASHTKGIINGAMVFDKKELQATYKLKLGKPGSSYAFAIASNIGLDEKLIAKAKSLIGDKENEVDKLLIDLQTEKNYLQDKLLKVLDQDDQLKGLIDSHQILFDDLQVRKKKMELDATNVILSGDKENRKELERLIQKLHKSADENEAKEASKKVKDRIQQNESKLKDLHYELNLELVLDEPIIAGDTVTILDGDQVGEVISVKANKALVSMGILTMDVNLSSLNKVKEKEQKFRRKRGTKYDLSNHRDKTKVKLDIRAIQRKEAIFLVQEFIENALINDALEIQVLHGKGTGSLRKMVKDVAKQYPMVSKISHPEDNQGGDGISIIRF